MDDISTLAGLNSKTPVEIITVYTKPLSPAKTLFQYKASLYGKGFMKVLVLLGILWRQTSRD